MAVSYHLRTSSSPNVLTFQFSTLNTRSLQRELRLRLRLVIQRFLWKYFIDKNISPEQVQIISDLLVPGWCAHQEEDVVLLQLQPNPESFCRSPQGETSTELGERFGWSYQDFSYQVIQTNEHEDIEISEIERILRLTDRSWTLSFPYIYHYIYIVYFFKWELLCPSSPQT